VGEFKTRAKTRKVQQKLGKMFPGLYPHKKTEILSNRIVLEPPPNQHHQPITTTHPMMGINHIKGNRVQELLILRR